MKALKVFESLDFQRGQDPISSMDIGIKTWLHNFDKNYFRIPSTEEREEMQKKFIQAMNSISYQKIPVNTDYFPIEFVFGRKDLKDYRQYKLDYDLYLSLHLYGDILNATAYLTDEKGISIASTNSSSAGREGVKTLLKRIHKKRIKS